MSCTVLMLAVTAAVEVERQALSVELDPAAHQARVAATLDVRGEGELRLRLTRHAQIDEATIDGAPARLEREPGDDAPVVRATVPAGARSLTLRYAARLEQDIEAGERPGQIHNFSVDAHVGPEGVFLSDGSDWHPRPLGANGRPMLHPISAAFAPIDGWALVASGDPVEQEGATQPLDVPRWHWSTPRPVDGLAVAGGPHKLIGVLHETAHGAVEIVMHVPEEHAQLAHMFLDAAGRYLDLYVPLLGAFPYRRFSMVENFFSSGFAYPGFTLLGPQVVGMAPRSLVPGYLDHELVHNWWGNGVYVDDAGGNWCEALTSYCANSFRRIAEEGPAAGRSYRRGVLMTLSGDPDGLDDGPLAAFGSANPVDPGPARFVGYDKGAFVFTMLEDRVADVPVTGSGDHPMWRALRRFADAHLGRRASWDDLQAALEAERAGRASGWLEPFFAYWVEQHHVPGREPSSRALTEGDPVRAALALLPAETGQSVAVRYDAGGAWAEIDPDFRMYRALPPHQIVPTLGGTLGQGGVRVEGGDGRPELAALEAQIETRADGENLLLIGLDAITMRADLLARADDGFACADGAFTVGGVRHDAPDLAVLHTVAHPERPGRFVTVFHANGDAGWSRLRLIGFYTRDTTIIWAGDRVVERRVHEPDRRLPLP